MTPKNYQQTRILYFWCQFEYCEQTRWQLVFSFSSLFALLIIFPRELFGLTQNSVYSHGLFNEKVSSFDNCTLLLKFAQLHNL